MRNIFTMPPPRNHTFAKQLGAHLREANIDTEDVGENAKLEVAKWCASLGGAPQPDRLAALEARLERIEASFKPPAPAPAPGRRFVTNEPIVVMPSKQ